MSRFGPVAALWIACVFVVWHVIFDRHVATAAVEFTREQVLRRQSGQPLTPIHIGFNPRVRQAAAEAALQASPLAAAGAVAAFLAFRRSR
jgi:hypothetical protein